MLQTRVQDGQIPADSSLQHSAVLRNTARAMSKKPAVLLAFLVVLVGIIWAISSQINTTKNLELPATAQQDSTASELEAAGEKLQLSSDPSVDVAADGSTNSVKIESTTNNGVTNTKLEVNGEKIPVVPNSTTHVTVPNGNQSVTNLTTHTSGGNGFNFNSNTSTSSSFSHSFSSQNTVGDSKK